jgi:hypothetical protein
MMTTTVGPIEKVWECRWSRPGYRVPGVPENFQPESRWVCMRLGDRRCISEDECERCPHFDLIPARAY